MAPSSNYLQVHAEAADDVMRKGFKNLRKGGLEELWIISEFLLTKSAQ